MAFVSCLILALFFLRRRSRKQKRGKERPVDLLHDDEDEDEEDHRRNPNAQAQHQLEYYTPEPFMVTDPTLNSDAATTAATDFGHSGPGSSSGRPLSGTSFTRSDTPDLLGSGSAYGVGGYGWAAGSTTTSTSRKGAAMRMRPVNIVQHEDAGPPPPIGGQDKEEEAETIELPPAYTAVQRSVAATPERTPPAEQNGGGGGGDTRTPGAEPGRE